MEDWASTMDEGKGLDIIFLDYQKAFDTVPQRKLAVKLGAYGLKGKVNVVPLCHCMCEMSHGAACACMLHEW